MHMIPTSGREWSSLVLFPFKAYTVIAFPCILALDHDDWLFRYSQQGGIIMVGYLLAGVVLVIAGLIQKYALKTQEAKPSFIFGAIALFIGFIVIPVMAPL